MKWTHALASETVHKYIGFDTGNRKAVDNHGRTEGEVIHNE